MNRRDRFAQVEREAEGTDVEFNLPGAASPPPSRRSGGSITVGMLGLLVLVLCLVLGLGGFFVYRALNNGQATPTTAPFVPGSTAIPGQVNPTQPSGSPIINTAVPGAPREKLNVCIVNFGPYFATMLIPDTNPIYDIEIIPMNFYETAEQLEAGQFMNPADESEQIAALTDGRCDILTTTLDVLSKHPRMGKLIAVLGQSNGADMTIAWNVGVTAQCKGKPINIFNDVRGCVIAVADDSVGYYQALSFLKLANITKDEVTINRYPTPDDAVAACLRSEADVCSGWVPTIDQMHPNATSGQTKVLVNSKFLKTIYDGVFVSNQANTNKRPAVLAFVEDLFIGVKMMQDDLPGAAEKIQQWTYNGMNTNEYTFVYDGSETDDLTLWFDGVYAQASFNSHFVFQSNPGVLYDILTTGREGWAWSGQALDDGFDPPSMVDLSYFSTLSGRPDLASQNQFVDPTFSPFPAQSDQPATREQLIALPTIVEVVCPSVYFRPGQTTIPQGSPEYLALITCGEQLKSLMNQSNVQILIVGSAAWPDPITFGSRYEQCGTFSEQDYCYGVARDRATFVLSIFTGQLQLPGNRFAIDYRLGEKTSDQDVLQENRFGAIEVKVGGLE